MKVAIITIHSASNQGACLQAFALQRAFDSLGMKAVILNYCCKKISAVDSIFNIHAINNFKSLVSQIIYIPRKYIRNSKFQNFRKQYMNLTTQYHSQEEMKNLENDYDFFCVGSDQVWNEKITGLDPTYMLSFITNTDKKISYASSIGNIKLSDKSIHTYEKYIKDFKSISVRENSAKLLLENLFKRDVTVVLDPTLLLSKDQWKSIITDLKVNLPARFILIYQIRKSKNLSDYAREISQKHNLPILKISDSYLKERNIRLLKGIGPREFVTLFHHAETIVTNSFHGTAFAVNFNKEFYSELSPEKENGNSRITDFLKLCGLTDRIIKPGEKYEIHTDINWSHVNELLKKTVAFSKDHLITMCGKE